VNGFFGAGGVVYVCQGVQLVDDYVYVVTAYTGGLYRDAFAFVQTCGGAELTVAYGAFNAVKQLGYCVHASRVAYKYDLIGQLLRFKVQMETGTVIVYDKFGWCKIGTHRLIGLGS
jgi:hypothetical protein